MTATKKKAGALIELMITVTIFLIVIAAMTQTIMSMNQNYKILAGYLTNYLKGRHVIDFIAKDIRMAIRVMDEYGAYASTTNCLVLKVPSLDATGDIVEVNNEFDYVIYKIEGDDLKKIVIPGAMSARTACDKVFEKAIKSLYCSHQGNAISSVPNKSVITELNLRVSLSEIVLGKEYQIDPGTSVKLMNYEWEFVR